MILPTGATLRASLDAFKGDYFDQELTFCRFDKILILQWKDDGKHHKDIWLRGRIVSKFFDEDERSLRYGISTQGVHTEGYFPANIAFYDLVQSSPKIDWWWVRAVDLAPIFPCRGKDQGQCSRHYTAGVQYSCTSCPAPALCGWCWVGCHGGHKGGVSLAKQGSHAVPWAGRVFSCQCSCGGGDIPSLCCA
jgi:hypothetical protein